MKVLIIPEVRQYFYELQLILYEKDYFSYLEDAVLYMKELMEDIKKNLPNKRSKPAPGFFKKYDEDLKYASFTKNKHTTWYVFFEIYEESGEIIYLVKHMENNHTAAQFLTGNSLA